MHEIIDDPQSKKIYIVMDYLQGGTLSELLDESESGLPLERVRIYFRGLLSAIHYCHEVKNIAHRDIKPENIMLDKYGEVYLCDFGVSEFFKSSNDLLSGGTKGTYLFMAPEMVNPDKNKQIIRGRQGDIWAAGVTLFNLLTGKYPFKGRGVVEL